MTTTVVMTHSSSTGDLVQHEVHPAMLERTRTQPENRGVQFGVVEVRTYKRGLSDNPSVTSGVPVGISWDVLNTTTTSLADFEDERLNARREQKMFAWEGRIDYRERLTICLDAGHTMEEIEGIMDQVAELQEERWANLSPQWDPFASAKAMFVSVGEFTSNGIRRITAAKMFGRKWKQKAHERASERAQQEGDSAGTDAVETKEEEDMMSLNIDPDAPVDGEAEPPMSPPRGILKKHSSYSDLSTRHSTGAMDDRRSASWSNGHHSKPEDGNGNGAGVGEDSVHMVDVEDEGSDAGDDYDPYAEQQPVPPPVTCGPDCVVS